MSLARARGKMKARIKRAPKASALAGSPEEPTQLSLKDHLRELQGRLFSIVAVFVIAAAIAYPFFDHIASWLLAPLKNEQELVYLTPGGAFSFIIKVCAYVGLIATLPVIIYHIYRFIMPAVQAVRLRSVLGYTAASISLAVCGILFAYYISLPAALYFLTGFDLNHINPMLTIDSYFSFIMTYMLAGAILFQVPLLMRIVNSVTPLTPKKLMSAQKHIIVGSFLVAAIISPTPDALNQTLLASPVIVMYQLGIVMLWLVNSRSIKKRRLQGQSEIDSVPSLLDSGIDVPSDIVTDAPATVPVRTGSAVAGGVASRPTMDIVNRPRPLVVPSRPVDGIVFNGERHISSGVGVVSPVFSPSVRSIDGIMR